MWCTHPDGGTLGRVDGGKGQQLRGDNKGILLRGVREVASVCGLQHGLNGFEEAGGEINYVSAPASLGIHKETP